VLRKALYKLNKLLLLTFDTYQLYYFLGTVQL